MLMMIKLGNWT